MQISENLPQFEKKSLFVVAGRRAADIYSAFNGEIEKKESIEIKNPRYSDKEGFFMRLGGGKFFGAGSVLEDKKIETNKKFIRELKDKTEESLKKDNVESVYLFAPKQTEKALLEGFSENIKQKVVFSFKGNYVNQHPFNLIKKIQKKQENKKPKLISEKAMKILKRGK